MAKITPLVPDDTSQMKRVTRTTMVKQARELASTERLGRGERLYFDITLDDIGDLGVGIRLYFMLTKYSAILLLLMGLCAVPTAIVHYYGHGVSASNKDPLSLNFLSLANEGVNPEYIPTNCTYEGGTMDCSLRTINTPLTQDPKMGAYIATICDCVNSIVFLLFIILFSYRCRGIVMQHARENITPAKYSIYVRGLPRDASEAEVMEHFNRLYDLSIPKHRFPLWFGCFGKRKTMKSIQSNGDIPSSTFPVENLSHVDENPLYMHQWIAQVCLARPIGKFLRLFLSMENLTEKIAILETILNAYEKEEKRFKKQIITAQFELTALKNRLEMKTNKMKSLKAQGNQRLNECECAFVIFNHVESQKQCLDDYRTSRYTWLRYFQPKELRFRGKFALKVVQAPEPSNIIWENLETTGTQRWLRRSLTSVITFLLLIVSCIIISLAQSAQQKFNRGGPTDLCNKIIDVYRGPNATSNSSIDGEWKLEWNQSETCSSASSFALHFVNQSAAPFPVNTSEWNAIDSNKNLTRCIATCFDTNETTCGTLPCFTTDRNRTSFTEPCEEYNPSDILVCYCKPKLEFYVSSYGLYNGPQLLWSQELPCRTYITAFLTKNGLLIAAAISVILVNTLLRGVFYAFASFERHSSESKRAAAVVFKLFFAQWINTAVIVLLVNAQLGNVPIFQSILSGKLTDMERSWYTSVGAGITLTMLVNVITPHIGPLLTTYLILPLKRCVKQFSAVTQPQMNSLFANPDFDISVRYPVVLNTLFVTFMYSGGIPALLPIGAISCAFNYAIDKLTLMKLYRIRTVYDEALGNLALDLLPWMLFLHLGFSSWAYGVSSVLQSDILTVSALAKQASSALSSIGQDTNVSEEMTAIDPTEEIKNLIEKQINEINNEQIGDLLRGILKAYLKIIRINTFPLFFFFLLVLLWLLLHRFLEPLLQLTIGTILKLIKRICRRSIRTSPLLQLTQSKPTTFPGFAALFERVIPNPTHFVADTSRGFEIDERGMLICRHKQTGERLRSWETTSAHVKTYAIEKNPKYKNAVANMLEANRRLNSADGGVLKMMLPDEITGGGEEENQDALRVASMTVPENLS